MADVPTINQETLEKAKNGNLAAFNTIVITFQKAIFNHLYRLTGNRDDAADLTQDTFFKVFKKKHQIDPEQNFKAWLYKIATHTAYDWFARKKRQNEIALVEGGDLETNEQDLPYYRTEHVEVIDLENALKKIKPQYQNIIYLYYQQGFSYKEIAEIINVPLGTVKTLLFRAKKALEEELK